MSALYAALARRRRIWYERHPGARRRLGRPVVSVGNVAVGGSGKTPAVAYLARLLVAAGERPAVLSRGYARAIPADGVIVVRGREQILADLAHAGDEPLMLARRLEGVAVLVADDRHLAGVLAERRFGATVHLLDDGFQHMMLERDVDLVLAHAADLDERRTLPGGRLREPLETLARADAVLIDGDVDALGARLGALGVRRAFQLTRRLEAPQWARPAGGPADLARGARVLVMAGIARPSRFASALRGAGWSLVGERWFRDHHPYSPGDVARVLRDAAAARADVVFTTEKDLVRLLPVMPPGAPVAWVPLTVGVQPEPEFRTWLLDRLAASRQTANR